MSITYKGVKNGGLNIESDGTVSTTRMLIYLFTAGESPVKISQETTFPVIGSEHPDDETLLISKINISEPQEGDEVKKGKYTVTVNYLRQTTNGYTQTPDLTRPPWTRKPYNVSLFSNEKVVPFVKAYDTGDVAGSPSLPVLNPAGDPYESTKSSQNSVLRFSFNKQNYDPNWNTDYQDSLNSSAVTVCGVNIPTKTGRIKSLQGQYMTQNDANGNSEYKYWQIDVEIEIQKEGWNQQIMRRGLYFIDTAGDSGKYRIYTDDQGNYGKLADLSTSNNPVPVDEPQKLNADGSLYTGDTASYDTFAEKPSVSWSVLSFPTKVY